MIGINGHNGVKTQINKVKREFDITTSDYDDQEIAENIAHNCRVNGISPVLPHIKREFFFSFIR